MKYIKLIMLVIKDIFRYYKNKEYQNFKRSGIFIYGGYFGSGKTLTVVNRILQICKKYPNTKITVLTNISLFNFPKNIEIVKFNNQEQLINRGDNTIVLLDEVGALFNSRNWKNKQISPLFFNRIVQTRKKHTLFFFIAQDISDIDIMLRKKALEVHRCRMYLKRFVKIKVYDGKEYEKYDGDFNIYLEHIYKYNYVATDKHFKYYDTTELVEQMEKEKYLSTEEIIMQTSRLHDHVEIENKKKGFFRRKK